MPRYNRPFDITHRSDKIGDTSQRLVARRVQHMQDCAHQQGVARFFPMVAAFERPVASEKSDSRIPALGPGVKLALIEGPMNEAVPFIVRIKFPAGARVPAHWHPAIEHVTVMSGTFEIGIGDKLDESKTMRFPAGSVTIMQPGTTHFGV
jgi:quercetin dioxygenase-like cupin family protein